MRRWANVTADVLTFVAAVSCLLIGYVGATAYFAVAVMGD